MKKVKNEKHSIFVTLQNKNYDYLFLKNVFSLQRKTFINFLSLNFALQPILKVNSRHLFC